MSLEILLALVIGGIAGIAALLHFLGLTAPHRFTDEATAAAAWEREVPELPVTKVSLATDAHAALITYGGGHGVVWSFGDDTVARILGANQPEVTQTGLRFTFPDFGSSNLDVQLDEKTRAAWLKLLEAQ